MYYLRYCVMLKGKNDMKPMFQLTTVLLLILHVGTPSSRLCSQIPWNESRRTNQLPYPSNDLFLYKTYAMPTQSPDTVRFTLYTKVANDLLQFVLTDSVYIAQYELVVAIKSQRGESIPGKIKKRKIYAENFRMTNARDRFTNERIEFYLPPGKYDLLIELLDIETKQPIRRKEEIKIPAFFSKPLTVTDLLFFHSEGDDSASGTEAIPDFPAVFSSRHGSFWIKFYVCSDGSNRSLTLKKTIFDNEGQTLTESSQEITLNSKIQPILLPIKQKLNFGQYSLSITLTDENEEIVLDSPFYVRWKSHSTFIPNLKQAVETTRYIMEARQWNQLQKLPEDEQKRILDQFWKERDPDPETEDNELEEEYYRRVAFTNHNLSTWEGGIDGWKTDRGRTYIIYGPPSEIDTPSTATGGTSHYEIWYYRNLQKRFVFLDRHGNGDYRLISEE
jgi:GWxTD domain-containing protein